MTIILLFFIPILMIVVVANMGQHSPVLRGLTYALLLISSALIAFAGIQFWLATTPILAQILSPDIPLDQAALGQGLAASGLLATVLVLAALIADRRGRRLQVGSLCLSCPVPLTALTLAILYAGGNFALVRALPDLSELGRLHLDFGVGELLAQNSGLVALAFLGVGLGVRRSLRSAWQRLDLRPLRRREFGIVLMLTMGMIVMSMVVGAVIAALFPDSVANANALNDTLLQAFSSVGGALLLGLLTGIGEELLYRGAVQPVFGLWLTSLIFALHHVQYLNPTFILILLLGLTLGWIRNRWGVSVAALTHACYNTSLVLIAISVSSIGS